MIFALTVAMILPAAQSDKRSQKVVMTNSGSMSTDRPNRFPAQLVIETEYDESTGILNVYNTVGIEGSVTLSHNDVIIGYSPDAECSFLLPNSQGVYLIIFKTVDSEFRGWLEL